jgi:hypothetical protein
MRTRSPRGSGRHRASHTAPTVRGPEAIVRFNGAWLSALSLLGIALTSLRFSLTLALNTMFGPDVLEVLRGPLDYLAASSFIIIATYNDAADRVTRPDGLLRSLDLGLTVAFLVLAAGVAWAFVHHHRDRLFRLASRTSSAVRSGKSWAQQRPWSWRVPSIVTASALSGALTYFVGRAALVVFTVALLPFVVGYWAAQSHFYIAVVEPHACAKSVKAADRRAAWSGATTARARGEDSPPPNGRPYGAVCVEVFSKETGTHRGRRIIATNESIALYDPASGTVQIVPRKDAVVTFVNQL